MIKLKPGTYNLFKIQENRKAFCTFELPENNTEVIAGKVSHAGSIFLNTSINEKPFPVAYGFFTYNYEEFKQYFMHTYPQINANYEIIDKAMYKSDQEITQLTSLAFFANRSLSINDLEEFDKKANRFYYNIDTGYFNETKYDSVDLPFTYERKISNNTGILIDFIPSFYLIDSEPALQTTFDLKLGLAFRFYSKNLNVIDKVRIYFDFQPIYHFPLILSIKTSSLNYISQKINFGMIYFPFENLIFDTSISILNKLDFDKKFPFEKYFFFAIKIGYAF